MNSLFECFVILLLLVFWRYFIATFWLHKGCGGNWQGKSGCVIAMLKGIQYLHVGKVEICCCNLALLWPTMCQSVCVTVTPFVCILTQTLLSVCLAVWLVVNWLSVPPGWLHHFSPYPPRTQWQPQPRETWVMVLSDVHPDSIEQDGRHTPKITKGGDIEWGGWVREGEGRSQTIDKAGTHWLIKIYSFLPPPPPLAIRLGREERGRRECD